jgi:tetratricopeptide (TPR) repeat protein
MKGMLKDYKGAITDLHFVIELNPGYAEAYYGIGFMKIQSGDKSEACSYFRKAKNMGYQKAAEALRMYCKRRK